MTPYLLLLPAQAWCWLQSRLLMSLAWRTCRQWDLVGGAALSASVHAHCLVLYFLPHLTPLMQ